MPPVSGHEFSGVITAIGKGVQDFEIGDESTACAAGSLTGPLRSSVLRCPRILALCVHGTEVR